MSTSVSCQKLLAAAALCEVKRGEINGGKILIDPFIADLVKWNLRSSYADGELINSGKRGAISYPYESVTFMISGYQVVDNPGGGDGGL